MTNWVAWGVWQNTLHNSLHQHEPQCCQQPSFSLIQLSVQALVKIELVFLPALPPLLLLLLPPPLILDIPFLLSIPYSPSFSHFRQSGMWRIVWHLQRWKESEPNQFCLEPSANCYSVSQGWSKCVPCTFACDPLNHNQNLITFLLTRTYLL